MKLLLSLIIAILALVTSVVCSVAAEPAKAGDFTYEGEINGVVCASCVEHVTTALMKKLDGAVSVEVKRGGLEGGPQKLLIVSKNGGLTKEDAVTAMGSYAKAYEILKLEKKKS